MTHPSLSVSALRKNISGFTLLELAVTLVIVSFLLFILLPTNSAILSNSRRAATVKKLANINQALINFVTVNKRLPCPADGTALTGVEGTRNGSGDCTTSPVNQANGVVPWVALGLSFGEALDSWDNQMTYRVGYGLTRNNALDMTSCDPAGTALANTGGAGSINLGVCNSTTCTGTFAAANCTRPPDVLQYKGLDVKSNLTTTVMSYLVTTGAAYVLISHGDNKYGAINNVGTYMTPPVSVTAITGTTLEDPNWQRGSDNITTRTVTAAAPPQFMDATFSDSDSLTAYFDDIVVRPMLYSVISQAQLGPRSH